MPTKRFIDLSGIKFGILTVLNFHCEKRTIKRCKGRNGGHYISTELFYMWNCRCDCGTEKVVSHKYLLEKRRKVERNCGCMKYAHIQLTRKESDHIFFVVLYCRYKCKAELRGIDFALNREIAKKMFESDCFYCGKTPNQIQQRSSRAGSYTYNGIDRLDSGTGYTEENCVPCCKTCNMAKGEMTPQQFAIWISRVYHRRSMWNISALRLTPFQSPPPQQTKGEG